MEDLTYLYLQIKAYVFLYEKLHICERGFSEGKLEAGKRITNLGLAKNSNFL